MVLKCKAKVLHNSIVKFRTFWGYIVFFAPNLDLYNSAVGITTFTFICHLLALIWNSTSVECLNIIKRRLSQTAGFATGNIIIMPTHPFPSHMTICACWQGVMGERFPLQNSKLCTLTGKRERRFLSHMTTCPLCQ